MHPYVLILLALAAGKQAAEAERAKREENPCDCPGCTVERELRGLIAARKTADEAKQRWIDAQAMSDAAESEATAARKAAEDAQTSLNTAIKALNAEEPRP